jgi:hypothetical protein
MLGRFRELILYFLAGIGTVALVVTARIDPLGILLNPFQNFLTCPTL